MSQIFLKRQKQKQKQKNKNNCNYGIFSYKIGEHVICVLFLYKLN